MMEKKSMFSFSVCCCMCCHDTGLSDFDMISGKWLLFNMICDTSIPKLSAAGFRCYQHLSLVSKWQKSHSQQSDIVKSTVTNCVRLCSSRQWHSCTVISCSHFLELNNMSMFVVAAGKLVAYDTDGDGDFDVEDAKVLLGKFSFLISNNNNYDSNNKIV